MLRIANLLTREELLRDPNDRILRKRHWAYPAFITCSRH
jgi:hypothetical protein